jgi:sterol desaturase/sphingolipid hydroxylase (fatty acid hydroxylase superfamily)
MAVALVIEVLAPLYRISWASRLVGFQLTLVKTATVAAILPVLSGAWTELRIEPIYIQSSVLGAVLTIFFVDFLAYWHHRFLHRFVWPVHATHHSIRELSAINGYSHFLENLTEFFLIAIPLSLIRWDSIAIPIAIVWITQWMAYWIHSPTSAQFHVLRHIFVTPRFHRIHHSLEQKHFDKNFGILFSFWDRMFGTAFIPDQNEWPDTGIADHSEPRSVWDYVVHPISYVRNSSRIGLSDQVLGSAMPSEAPNSNGVI